MPKWLSNDMYEADRTLTVEALAQCLFDGSLTLFLGAGISAKLGLPQWKELVKRCGVAARLPAGFENHLSSTAEILRVTDRIEAQITPFAAYRDLVTGQLYADAPAIDDARFLEHTLLIAIGSMLMNSRRGSVAEVVNFNFDDILERYLRLHGFMSQVVTNLPVLFRAVDVTVFHPHGFLPSDSASGAPSNFLIFSKDSFDSRLGEALDPWQQTWQNLLLGKVGMFIGLSPEGPNFGPAITQVRKQIGTVRPTCFWFYRAGEEEEHAEQIRTWRGVPIKVDDYDEIPRILLHVCRKAGEMMR